eukprot:436090_1
MTILKDTITIQALLNALKKGITNAQNALLIAKMVSELINKSKNNQKQILRKLANELQIVDTLTNCIIKHSTNSQIVQECQHVLELMICTLIALKPSELPANETEQSEYKYGECGKICEHLCNLKTHKKNHTDFIYVCSFCNKRFGRKSNYIEHISNHTVESPFQCNVCHKRFKQKKGLKNHFKKSHLI